MQRRSGPISMGVTTGLAICRPLVTLVMERHRQKGEATDEVKSLQSGEMGCGSRPPFLGATRTEAERNTQRKGSWFVL